MAWVYLVVAILFEVSGTTSMKLSRGFSELWPSVAVVVLYGLSIVFLTLSIHRIDISIAYAIWSALGTALVATIGFVHFGEAVTAWKLFFLAVIVLGVVGLNLSETA
jgi:small multidrug resistance pump